MKTWTIYCAYNTLTGQTYVGQTCRSFEQRRKEHMQGAWGYYFHDAIRAHGFDAFKWSVIVERVQSLEEANAFERAWISELGAHVSTGGYNLTYGGDGTQGFTHSAEAREKIGARWRGLPKSEEHKRRMGEAISKARRGKTYGPRKFKNPEQAYENASRAQKNRPPRNPHKHSEETKEKLRRPRKCSVCQQFGHRRTNCPNGASNAIDDSRVSVDAQLQSVGV